MNHLLLFLVTLWAGAQNALAGGGSFLTLPMLMLTGMDARAANITSCVGLFPAQIAIALAGRSLASGVAGLSLRLLTFISIAGGAIGAAILLVTPADFFARLVPWLVLFATAIFVWGSFFRKAETAGHVGPAAAGVMQMLISIYGGYFGGGIGFLMIAALTLAGEQVRAAGATKNVLAAVMNASAVLIFLFSPDLRWTQAATTMIGATIGGLYGAKLLHVLDEKLLRVFVALIGAALTIGLFWKAV
ncbi:MAG TPA: sulfite exporter TauE/SafE family protein [Methylocystis sp.]|nr:sulfite exporter TauE/SafE family protein [Methylocystis sp.]